MNRQEQILNRVAEAGRIEVSELSEIFLVSKVTIRKDLDKLEEKGLLKREHGYAVILQEDSINHRLSIRYDIKKRIAQSALKLVKDNDTVFIESGSTCALLAELICQERSNVTIITNSCFIAEFISKYDNGKTILLGGEYQSVSQVTVGPLLRHMINYFKVPIAFIGTDGYDSNLGFTNKDLRRTEVVQEMAKCSDSVVILTDSSKFSKRGIVVQFQLDEISQVITDKDIPESIKKQLEEVAVHVESV